MSSLQMEVFDSSGESPKEKESTPAENNVVEVEESTSRSSDQTQTETPLMSPNAASKQDVKIGESEEAHGSGQSEPKQAENDDTKTDTESESKEKSSAGAVSPTTNAESAENGAAGVSDPTKCILCDTVLTRSDRPMLLECLHSACAACIDSKLQEQPDQEIVDSNAVLCPWCSIASARSNLIVDRLVLERCSPPAGEETSGDNAAEVCVSCEESIPAASFCVDCEEMLCDACVQVHNTDLCIPVPKATIINLIGADKTFSFYGTALHDKTTAHRRVRVTKDHNIVEKSQAEGQRQRSSSHDAAGELRCSTHPAELLSLFCEKCDRLTCRDCQLTEHREHKYKFVNEIASDARQSLSTLLNEVTYKRGLLESAVKVIDKRQAAINEKRQQVVQEITRLVILLTNAINGRGKQLVQRLTEVCENKQRTLQEKRTTLQQLTRLTDHCIASVSTQLDAGSDLALLWSKKTIMRHLQRIKSRRADIPNPDIPVRIHFAQQRVDTLCNALATVGGIVVDGRAYPHTEPSIGGTKSPVPASTQQSQSQVQQATAPVQQQGHSRGAAQLPPHQQHVVQHAVQQANANLTIRPGSSHQVSSSTHPGVQQLRSLLSPAGTAVMKIRATGLPNLRPILPAPVMQSPGLQLQGTLQVQGLRPPMHRPPPPLTPANTVSSPHSRAPVWHIPPDRPPLTPGHGHTQVQQVPLPNDNFRITLTKPWLPPAEQVSSTGNQRSTPSPATKAAAHDPALNLDTFCQKSMDDLLSTIAILDRESPRTGKPAVEATASSMVDSSTGSPSQAQQRQPAVGLLQTTSSPVKDDPNEDWCAVCMDGGDLVCCDRCPKVFHTHCHIPQLGSIDETPDSWQCLLCTPIQEIVQTSPVCEEGGLNARQRRLAQRLLLELYCQYDHSQPFREPVNTQLFPEYPRVVEHPMSLDIIKKRLEPTQPDSYTDIQQFIDDVRLIFKNAYAFNPKMSGVYGEARALDKVFEGMLEKWLPEYTKSPKQHASADEDEEGGGPAKRCKKIRLE